MIDHDLVASVGDVIVTALPPDLIPVEGPGARSQLNLFMYQVTPNQGWRNVGLPSRDGRGERLTNPPLALDLHYLLTAYGVKDFHTDILLGYATQLLHETPVLTRDAIRKALALPSPVEGGGGLPPPLEVLAASELADQVEQIKIIPQSLNTEEIMKLWAAFQARYRPTAAYQASVVLIEATHPGRSPLPVLTRGRPDLATGRDEGVFVQPHLVPPFPTLQEAIPPNQQVAVRMGEILTLRGHHLDGDTVVARFTHARSGRSLELQAEDGATAAQFQVQIPPDPAPDPPPPPDSPQNPDNWQAGFYNVAGVIQRTGQPDRTTNELPVVLAPRINSIVATALAGVVTLTVTCSPKALETQRVTLVIRDREITAEPITPDQTDTLTFKAKDLPTGSQRVRLRVDGAESILIDRRGPLPVFDPTQRVTIP
jgi:hypothetical protein